MFNFKRKNEKLAVVVLVPQTTQTLFYLGTFSLPSSSLFAQAVYFSNQKTSKAKNVIKRASSKEVIVSLSADCFTF